MIPEQGQRVKCFMRSTMVLEGIVQEWADTQIVLKSIDDQSILIVHHPNEDIILTKVVLQEPQEIVEETYEHGPYVAPRQDLTQEQLEIKKQLDKVLCGEDPSLEKMNLQQLRKLVVQQDKNIITQKRKEHFGEAGSSKKAVQYSPQIAFIPVKKE